MVPKDSPPGNLDLWNQVCETDPAHTKHVRYGSRQFTDVDAQWLRQRATELWGPYGTQWGLQNLRWSHITGERTSALVLECTFVYPGGMFEIANDMPYDPKDEAYKKLHTNTLSKALSFLGFSADVYLGRFDDSRYVEEMNEKFGNTKPREAVNGRSAAPPPDDDAEPPADDLPTDPFERAKALIARAVAPAEITPLFKRVNERVDDKTFSADQQITLLQEMVTKLQELEKRYKAAAPDAAKPIIEMLDTLSQFQEV